VEAEMTSTTALEKSSELIELGRKLFNDPRLSGNQKIFCAQCHNLKLGGADPRGISPTVDGKPLRRNAPTVYNAVFNFRQTWDGHARTLKEQAAGVITNPLEMGGEWDSITQRLSDDPEMRSSFQKLFKTGISKEGITTAIAAFEETLVALDSPYDRYIAGDLGVLDQTELNGLELFHSLGCSSCHNGAHFGGNQFQHIAIFYQLGGDQDTTKVGTAGQFDISQMEPHKAHVLALSVGDQGRFEVTGEERDRLVFKVPSLRNVELTAPYFHNGSVTELETAVTEMAAHQLGVLLSPVQAAALVAFLKTLTSTSLKIEPLEGSP
jgi:cytochrome c peroxidase